MSMERSMTTSNDNPSNDNTDNTDYTQASNLSLYSMEVQNTEFYEPTEEEKEGLCAAFSLLDTDGDGVIALEELEQQLISWGRLPLNEEHEHLMSYVKGTGWDEARGMDFEGFQKYITKQLANTTDEETLRDAFQVFDSDPPTGKVDVAELRHNLKHTGMKLTDDEIDFLFREEDYWMLEENKTFEYEQLISKILNKPTCKSPFLNC